MSLHECLRLNLYERIRDLVYRGRGYEAWVEALKSKDPVALDQVEALVGPWSLHATGATQQLVLMAGVPIGEFSVREGTFVFQSLKEEAGLEPEILRYELEFNHASFLPLTVRSRLRSLVHQWLGAGTRRGHKEPSWVVFRVSDGRTFMGPVFSSAFDVRDHILGRRVDFSRAAQSIADAIDDEILQELIWGGRSIDPGGR